MKPHSRSISHYPKKLRDAAIQEVKTTQSKTVSADKLKFDNDHNATPKTHDNMTAEQFDSENWVAKYPGQNCEHIGNGSGGVR